VQAYRAVKKIGLFNVACCVKNNKNNQLCANFNDNGFINKNSNVSKNRHSFINKVNIKGLVNTANKHDNVKYTKNSPLSNVKYKGFESFNIFDILCDEYILDDDVFLPAEGDQQDSSPKNTAGSGCRYRRS
jgi:hypothetical protein